jgi:hypothetical protein
MRMNWTRAQHRQRVHQQGPGTDSVMVRRGSAVTGAGMDHDVVLRS